MMRMPQNGDRYRARDDVTVQLLAMHGEVGMSYSNAVIPRGEVIEIEGEVNVANEVSAIPVRYEELETVLVPASDLEMPAYGGYMLFVEVAQLHADFDLVSK